MRSFAAIVIGALLAVAAAFVLNACAGPDSATVHQPLQVTSPPARP
ncbi:hypothetical protein [Embleya sp. AB8]